MSHIYTSAFSLVSPINGGLTPSEEVNAIQGYYSTLSAGLDALKAYVRTNGHTHIVLASPSRSYVWYIPGYGDTPERVRLVRS